MPGAQDGHLADPTGNGALMTFRARLRIVNRPQPILNFVTFLKCFTVISESCLRHHAIGFIIKARWRFGKCLTDDGAIDRENSYCHEGEQGKNKNLQQFHKIFLYKKLTRTDKAIATRANAGCGKSTKFIQIRESDGGFLFINRYGL